MQSADKKYMHILVVHFRLLKDLRSSLNSFDFTRIDLDVSIGKPPRGRVLYFLALHTADIPMKVLRVHPLWGLSSKEEVENYYRSIGTEVVFTNLKNIPATTSMCKLAGIPTPFDHCTFAE